MYHYSAFGLCISSEIAFPELFKSPINNTPEVQIKLGQTPKKLEEVQNLGNELRISPQQYLYHIPNVAQYYAENGNLIIVEPYPESDMKSIRIYLLCNAMAAIIHQRGMIPLHASGILTNERVVLLIGDSGAGKSTTIKALMARGYKIFTDDVCVVKPLGKEIVGNPSYPMMKLWENSLDILQLEGKREEHRIWPDTNKYGLFFHDEFISSWQKIGKIFILESGELYQKPFIERQNVLDAFKMIGQNTYRSEYIAPMQLNALHFTIVSSLVKQCPVYKIGRPAEINSIREVVELIENEI